MSDKLERKDPRFKKIQITVDAYLPWIENEDGVGGEGLLTFFAFATDVTSPETGEKLGIIGGGLGSVILTQPDDKGMWMIHHDDLWFAFQKALGEQ